MYTGKIMMKRKVLSLAVASALGASTAPTLAQDVEVPQILQPHEIEEVFVLGEFIPDEKRDTSEISNVLDTDALNALGETNVGVTLSRVTGLSLVGGKYVYVRGLGERYSSTLLNATRISSPVPFQKTVPLDIVPNQIVESLLVQKTFSAQYPGDFSGGVVDIRTKSTPDEDFANIKLSIGGNSETTGGDGLYYSGGSEDNWGWDDGTRDIPRNVDNMSSEDFEDTVFPERAALGASFYNNWDIREKTMKPNMGAEFEFGKRIELEGDSAIGGIASFKYSNTWNNRFTDVQRYEFSGIGDDSTQTLEYDETVTRQTIGMNGFVTLGYEFDMNHSVALTYTLMRQTTDTLEQQKGLTSEDDVSDGTYARNYRLEWAENEIETIQLTGEHYFMDLNEAELTWRIVDGSAFRDAPDTRTYTYAENRDGVEQVVTPSRQAAGDLRDVFQAPERNYSRLDDELEDYGFDFQLPVMIGDIDVSFNAGAGYYERTRETEDRLFRFDLTTKAPDYVASMTPSQLFAIDNWQDEYLTVRDFTAGAANASGIFPFAESGEEVTAYYGQFDAQLTDRIRLQGGVRKEDVTLSADAWGGNTDPGTINQVEQDYDDTLPALSITYEFIENMQVRMAWSETVNRPSLLEITGSTVRNPEDGNLYRGNVFLEPAELTNYDFRWEWYFGGADSMSLGAFKKEFDNPIELAKVQAQNDIFTWFNAEEAELEGLEYDISKELFFGEWFGWDGDHWNNFRLGANVSYIESEVTLLGSGETADDVPLTGGRQIARLYSNERPITGQSDWLGNLILTYEDDWTGILSTLTYNYTGERLILVGSESAPDIMEEARGRVDFLFRYTMPMDKYANNVEFELKIGNVFDAEVEWTQGGLPYERYEPGQTYSFSMRANF